MHITFKVSSLDWEIIKLGYFRYGRLEPFPSSPIQEQVYTFFIILPSLLLDYRLKLARLMPFTILNSFARSEMEQGKRSTDASPGLFGRKITLYPRLFGHPLRRSARA